MSVLSGFTFIEPKMLLFAAGLPGLAGLIWWGARSRKKAIARFSEPTLFQTLNPTLRLKGKTSVLRPALMLGALMLVVLGLARPGGHPIFVEQEIGEKGVDIMLMIDLSSSMAATDLKPDRLSATKAAVRAFLDQLQHDRVGLTVFAGVPSLQAPLTQDYRTAKMMIDILSTNFMPVDGTAIGTALDFAVNKISPSRRKGAVIVLLTDGENTKGPSPNEAIAHAKKEGVIIYTIGIGTAQGAKIPDGTDERGQGRFKMYRGEPVVTKLDEALLKEMAKQTGGQYYSADSNNALMQAYNEIRRLTKKEISEKKTKAVYQEYYVWVIGPALLMLMLEMVMGRRSKWFFKHDKSKF